MAPKPWEIEPVELSDGRLVCPHGSVVCGICTVDYSFMDDILEDDECHSGSSDPDEGNGSNTKKRAGESDTNRSVRCDRTADYWPPPGERGMPPAPRNYAPGPSPSQLRVTCDRFEPPEQPNAMPWHVFNHASGNLRFTRKVGSANEVLVYTDGACLDNGKPNARGGCAFVYRPEDSSQETVQEYISFALEKKGPTGAEVTHTSNRAELRAIISALHFRAWQGEGFDRVVVATDSSYVVQGITKHIKTWLDRDWKTARGTSLMNRDLWQMLLARLRDLQRHGLEVSFWLIPREWNSKADLAAREAADKEPNDEFGKIAGIMV